MTKTYRVIVFGKSNCKKCTLLQTRIDNLVRAPEWQDFEKHYFDVETEDGIFEFCRAGCVNPQRLPAFVVQRHNPRTDAYDYIADTRQEAIDRNRLYVHVGIQTDYSDSGGGVLPPEAIEGVFAQARASA